MLKPAGFLVPYKTAEVALVQRSVLQQRETLAGSNWNVGCRRLQFSKALDARVIAVSSSWGGFAGKRCSIANRADGATNFYSWRKRSALDERMLIFNHYKVR